MLLLLLGWCPKIPIGTQRISNSTSPSAFLILWFNVIEITSAKFSGRAQIPPAVDGEIMFDSNWTIARLIRVQLMLFKGHCKRSCRSYCRPWICGSGSESNSASRFQKNDIFFLQVKNVPLEFSHFGETYVLQGALSFRPSSAGSSGEGHYSAVCLRNGRLVLCTNSTVRLDAAKIKFWLQRCRMLVYASLAILT